MPYVRWTADVPGRDGGYIGLGFTGQEVANDV